MRCNKKGCFFCILVLMAGLTFLRLVLDYMSASGTGENEQQPRDSKSRKGPAASKHPKPQKAGRTGGGNKDSSVVDVKGLIGEYRKRGQSHMGMKIGSQGHARELEGVRRPGVGGTLSTVSTTAVNVTKHRVGKGNGPSNQQLALWPTTSTPKPPKRTWSDVRKDCNYRCYLDRYPKLKRRLDNDLDKAQRHYIERGHKAGRDCTCVEELGHCPCGRYNRTLHACIGAEAGKCETCALWESWPPLPEHKKPKYKTAEIVVAFCTQDDFTWLENSIKEAKKHFRLTRVTVYSKCGGIASLLDVDIVEAENVGRNDHTWLYHIATYYNDLADVVFFLKDTSFVYPIEELQRLINTMPNMIRSVVRHSFACGRKAHHGASIWHLRHELWKFRMPKYRSAQDYNQLPENFLAPLNFCSFLSSNLSEEDLMRLLRHALLPVCYGGTFASTRTRIIRTRRQTWRRLAGALTRGDNIEEGHYLERLWASLLAPLLESKTEDKLMARSAGMHTRFGEILGYSYMGSLKGCCCNHAGDVPLGDNLRPTKWEVSGMFRASHDAVPSVSSSIVTPWDLARGSALRGSLTVAAVSHSWDMDGAPQYLWRVAKYLVSKGDSVVGVSPKAGSLGERYRAIGAQSLLLPEVANLPSFSFANYTSWELNMWNEAMLKAVTNMTGERLDLIIYNTVLWAPIVAKNQRHCLLRPRLMWLVHEFEIVPDHPLPSGFWWGERYKELKSWALRATCANADAIVFVSRLQRDLWSRHDTGNFYTLWGLPQLSWQESAPGAASAAVARGLANGTGNRSSNASSHMSQAGSDIIEPPDLDDEPPPTRELLGIPAAAFVMTAVGSYCKRKQQLWMIRALERLVTMGIDAYLLLIGQASSHGGGGEMRYVEAVELAVQAEGLQGRVKLIPFGPDPARYVALADLHLSASTHEAYPLNTLEAMTLGVPVVATAAGGTEEQFISQDVQWLLVRSIKLQSFVDVVLQAFSAFVEGALREVGQRMKADHVDAVQRFEVKLEEIVADMTQRWSQNRATLGQVPICDLTYTCWRKDARKLGHEL